MRFEGTPGRRHQIIDQQQGTASVLESGYEAAQQSDAGRVVETPEDAAQEEYARQEFSLNVFVEGTHRKEFSLPKGHSVCQRLLQTFSSAMQQGLRRVLDLELEFREAAGKLRSERTRLARDIDNESLFVAEDFGVGREPGHDHAVPRVKTLASYQHAQ
jgi:hypothetical protein